MARGQVFRDVKRLEVMLYCRDAPAALCPYPCADIIGLRSSRQARLLANFQVSRGLNLARSSGSQVLYTA